MKKLKCAVIGLGIGKHHVEGYQTHPLAEVVALADTDETRLQTFSKKFGVEKQYRDGLEMIQKEDLDIVSIATPNSLHKSLTLEALKRGCHVLCEKPMALNAKEAREMLEVAKSVNKRIMINFAYRFTEQSQSLKKQIDSGILGDIYFGRSIWLRRYGMPIFGGWFGQKKLSGGGPLIDLGVHRLDLALWLMGYPKPTWVMASTYDPIAGEIAKLEGKAFDVEDFAAAMIKFENGATLEVEASWASHIKEKELMQTRLLGTKGGLVQRNLEEGYQFEAEIYTTREGSLFDSKLHQTLEPARSSMYHFVENVLNETPHPATGEEGLIVMELLDAIYKSAEEGRPIQILDNQ